MDVLDTHGQVGADDSRRPVWRLPDVTYRHLLVRREGPVERVTLNRPDVRNAFNEEVIDDLARWAESARTSEGLRVAVLDGAGKVFCAGADLVWMSKMVG